MPYLTTAYQIAAGNNNAGGLTAITSLSDANGISFVEPFGLGLQTRGQRQTRANGTIARRGFPRAIWTSNLLLAQWEYLKDTYEAGAATAGLVTVRLALSGDTFANYNAVLTLQEFEEMEYTVFAADGTVADFTGPGFRNAQWLFTRLEAL